ncbi:MAG: hypothetical protein K8W52_07815 [Deltaproteobacteria bacterium]|nr:hypothetical protein [Deltaproteobacteria bacterium]
MRRDDGGRRAAWDDCRMNGLGAFARRELGLDLEAGAGAVLLAYQR